MASVLQGKNNPFSFKAGDPKMEAENAVNYIPPEKRKLIKDYLSNSSLKYLKGKLHLLFYDFRLRQRAI